ncbi:hypothetical protein [Sinomonas sp. P47F7]|uniref:hypothetical protein n=1 Tax=Sinomonas sp. P47F7 TaxID=3410987 RepID=UPI003BF4867E
MESLVRAEVAGGRGLRRALVSILAAALVLGLSLTIPQGNALRFRYLGYCPEQDGDDYL